MIPFLYLASIKSKYSGELFEAASRVIQFTWDHQEFEVKMVEK
jgi:hypothetical protein